MAGSSVHQNLHFPRSEAKSACRKTGGRVGEQASTCGNPIWGSDELGVRHRALIRKGTLLVKEAEVLVGWITNRGRIIKFDRRNDLLNKATMKLRHRLQLIHLSEQVRWELRLGVRLILLLTS